MTQSMMTDNGRLQDAQNITHSQKTTDQDAEKEGGNIKNKKIKCRITSISITVTKKVRLFYL